MTLAAELEAVRTAFMTKAPAEVRQAMTRADADLAASGVISRALQAGERAPPFVLPNAVGQTVRLPDLLVRGPVVVSFYRGGWCPYCNLELRALQRHREAFSARGATLVAVSPQTPDESLSTADKNALDFEVLSDAGSEVAKAFGVAFELDEALRPIYAQFGHALPDKNGDESWTLPIPATYVIDRDGAIAFTFLDVDYRRRLEPADILSVLDALVALRAA